MTDLSSRSNLLACRSECLYPASLVVRTARAPVAQLDRALPSEGRGREFESRRVRHPAAEGSTLDLPEFAQADVAVAPDDQMVVQDHAECRRGFFDVLGYSDVGLGRGRVAGGVVVQQDQRRGAEIERALDDLARVDRGVVDRAALLALVLDQHVLA